LDGAKAGVLGRLSFYWKAFRATSKTDAARAEVADRLEKELFPRIVADHKRGLAEDLSKVPDKDLLEIAHGRIGQFWQVYGAEAFTATLLGDYSLEQLSVVLKKSLGEEEGGKLVAKAVSSGIHSTTADANLMLAEIAAGKRDLKSFLDAHGHRAAGELELATPRWREDREAVERMVATFRDKPAHLPHADANGKADPVAEEIDARVGVLWRPKALAELEMVRRYLSFRETAKHYVMMGYELIRLALLELDRRWNLHHGIFYLEEGELDVAHSWPDVKDVVAKRKHERELMLKVPLRDVVFSDELDDLGKPTPPPAGATEFAGLPVSPGVAEGPVRVVFDPQKDRPEGRGYILVCPSTDPGWTPLFVNAAGLVLERGGMLSHGSLVAREFGLPAVAGIDQITRAVADGKRVRVDGDRGKVYILGD
jgi:pyruvate,water dikinase